MLIVIPTLARFPQDWSARRIQNRNELLLTSPAEMTKDAGLEKYYEKMGGEAVQLRILG